MSRKRFFEAGSVETFLLVLFIIIGFALAGGLATYKKYDVTPGQLTTQQKNVTDTSLQLRFLHLVQTTATPTPTPTPDNSGGEGSGGVTPVPNATGPLHVNGPFIIDSTNKAVLLRGAMMESSLAYINRWQKGDDPTQILNTNTFSAMKSWNMNALRINISQWIYNLDPTLYMSRLDTVVQQANAAGLYVILDFHDDGQSGSPYGDGMLHSESLAWWKTIASHFANNPMILFDPINEPHYPNWNTWLHGNGSTIIGFQAIVAGIRSTGAQQIIVIEPGSAGGSNNAEDGGWATVSMATIQALNDTNILPSKHDYHNVVAGNPTLWDNQWGPLLNNYPIYYGEWAALPNPNHPVHCTGLTSSNADKILNTFLQYLQLRNANWTYWDFEPYRLIENYANFKPTSFKTGAPWSCPNGVHAGGGEDVKAYLLSH